MKNDVKPGKANPMVRFEPIPFFHPHPANVFEHPPVNWWKCGEYPRDIRPVQRPYLPRRTVVNKPNVGCEPIAVLLTTKESE